MNEHCWICANPASTGEHFAKASDVRAMFGRRPIKLHVAGLDEPIKIQGAKSDLLKYRKSLCADCNGSLTQPFDNGWSIFVAAFLQSQLLISSKGYTRLPKLLGPAWRDVMHNVHMYWLKQAGCFLVESGLDIHRGELAQCLRTGLAYPQLHLVFASLPEDANGFIHRSGGVQRPNLSSFVFTYAVGSLAVTVALLPEKGIDLRNLGAWHPHTGGKTLRAPVLIDSVTYEQWKDHHPGNTGHAMSLYRSIDL